MRTIAPRTLMRCALVFSVACAPGPRASAVPPERIVLERSGCFGNCPAYRVVLSADGTVTFEGRRFAVRHASDHITPQAVRALLARFEDANFAAIDTGYTQGGSRCGGFVWDVDGAALTVERATGSHRVAFYNGCMGTDTSHAKLLANRHYVRPEAFTTLSTLAAAVDSAASTLRWFRTQDWYRPEAH